MRDWEKRLVSEIRQLQLIDEDIKTIKKLRDLKSREPYVPEFITDPQKRQEVFQLMQFTIKYESFDITKTSHIPLPIFRGPDFEERLREVMDVDEMI